MSPRQAINRFDRLVAKHDLQAMTKPNPLIRSERDCLVAGVFFLGLQKANRTRYYFRPGEDKDKSTDIEAVTVEGSTGNQIFKHFKIQITEYEEHNRDIIGVIEKKIKRQLPPEQENRNLLVNLRGHGGEKFDSQLILQGVNSLKPNFKTIWLTMSKLNDEWSYIAMQIWPINSLVRYNVLEELNNQEPPDWVKLRLASKTSVAFSLSDSFDLPIP